MTNTGDDLVTKIMKYEQGELNYEDSLDLFQELIDSGQVWSLQGHYGRTAVSLLEAGVVTPKREEGE